LGHLPALSPRIIPAAVGIVLVDLVPFLPQARPPLCGAGLVGHISGRISPTGESLLRFLHNGSSSRTLEYWETAGKRIANLQARERGFRLPAGVGGRCDLRHQPSGL